MAHVVLHFAERRPTRTMLYPRRTPQVSWVQQGGLVCLSTPPVEAHGGAQLDVGSCLWKVQRVVFMRIPVEQVLEHETTPRLAVQVEWICRVARAFSGAYMPQHPQSCIPP